MIIKMLFLFFIVGIGLCQGLSEGSECTWGEYKGTCMPAEKCQIMIKDSRLKELPPTCDDQGTGSLVCCTECPEHHVVNNSLGMMNPYGGIVWKTGRKAWDACYEYMETLPYLCKSSYYSGLQLFWNKEKQCHNIGFFGIGGPPTIGDDRPEHPHTALLGYGQDLESAEWLCRGSLITNKYILTAAHCTNFKKHGQVKYVAVGILRPSDAPSSWQRYTIKRAIVHPEYAPSQEYHDVALLETDKAITFNHYALPACLPVNPAEDADAFTIVSGKWGQEPVTSYLYKVDMKKVSDEDCRAQYPPSSTLKGFDSAKQMCYAEVEYPVQREHCLGDDGSPLLINGQVSKCQDTILGVTSRGGACVSRSTPILLTRLENYVPWIESVVWP